MNSKAHSCKREREGHDYENQRNQGEAVSLSAPLVIGLASYEISCLAAKPLAFPAFARKYRAARKVCHVPGFQELNEFGNQVRDQGNQFGADVDLPTHEGITMGYWPVSFRTTVCDQIASVRTDGSGLITQQGNSSGFVRSTYEAGQVRAFSWS